MKGSLFLCMILGNCSVEIHSENVGSLLVMCEMISFNSLLNPGRYLPEERRTHNLHFDSHAFATVVLGLTSPEA